MARYPEDPNNLIRDIVALNERARTLRDEGWQVELKATADGARAWVEISTCRACDPPAREADQ